MINKKKIYYDKNNFILTFVSDNIFFSLQLNEINF
jgi:hypothetical protein